MRNIKQNIIKYIIAIIMYLLVMIAITYICNRIELDNSSHNADTNNMYINTLSDKQNEYLYNIGIKNIEDNINIIIKNTDNINNNKDIEDKISTLNEYIDMNNYSEQSSHSVSQDSININAIDEVDKVEDNNNNNSNIINSSSHSVSEDNRYNSKDRYGIYNFELSESDINLLIKLVYLEGNVEGYNCKRAIVSCVLNRVNSGLWGYNRKKIPQYPLFLILFNNFMLIFKKQFKIILKII